MKSQTLSNPPNSASKPNHFHQISSLFQTITTHINTHLPNFANTSPNFARIPQLNEHRPLPKRVARKTYNGAVSGSMSNEEIEERLAGVPVYALSNANEEFVLISGTKSKKSIGLFCFKKEDADSLLDQMRAMDPSMRRGSRVVPVALNKVFQLKVNGVAFRLIPEPSQVQNALKEQEETGSSEDEFLGVPVFQSLSLTLRANDKTYRPVFFRKEDLVNSLFRASKQQQRLNPAFRQGDIQVAVLEDIIKGMKDGSGSKWRDVVFIPPGFDVSTDHPSQNRESAIQ